MESLTSIVFLALMAGIPILMIGVLAYRLVRWAVLRAGWKNTLAERGWRPHEDESLVRAALEDAGFPTKRAWLTWLAQKDGAFVARYRHRAGRSGETRRVLVVPRATKGPCGTLQPRLDGLIEGVTVFVASAVVGEPGDFDGWEWALVFARGEQWLDPAASPPLRDFLQDGEMLAFGNSHVVLALPDGEVPDLLDRLDGLSEALGGASGS